MINTKFFPPRSLASAMFAVTLTFLSLENCFSQDTLQITFEGPPSQPRGTQYLVQEYDESGMWFVSLGLGNGVLRNGGGASFYPDDGTAYLQSEAGIVFGFADGRQFDLLSVDLAEFSTVWSGAVTVDFIGYHQDGSTVTAMVTTDGLIDGPGPLADFQTFTFQGFTDVVRVEMPNSPISVDTPYSMDNLIVAVPEPASASLLLLGGLSFYAMRQRREKRTNESQAMLNVISSGGASRRRRAPREAANFSIRAPGRPHEAHLNLRALVFFHLSDSEPILAASAVVACSAGGGGSAR